MSRGRLIETTLLILAGLLLAIATVNDVVDQTHVNHRLIADLRTWRSTPATTTKTCPPNRTCTATRRKTWSAATRRRDRRKNGSSCACR